MLATAAMLVTAASGSLAFVAASAVILGLGYGATAPAATHLIVPRTPPGQLNLILSIRQIGVPLGGTLSGLLVPPMVLAFGWQTALLVQVVPALVLLLVMQAPRARWDADRAPAARLRLRGALVPLRLLRADRAVRNLTFAMFLYAGIQLCFIAFLVVHLTSGGVADLVRAGQALAVFQVSGVVSRPIWGAIADRWTGARALLVLHGAVMAAAGIRSGADLAGVVVPGRVAGVRGCRDHRERVHGHRLRRVPRASAALGAPRRRPSARPRCSSA